MNSRSRGTSHVVEDHEGILLVEAAGQWMVEAIVRRRHRIATEELQARRAHRHAERKRIVIGALRQRRCRIDRDLVGEGCQRGQHPRAAHHDAVLRLAHFS